MSLNNSPLGNVMFLEVFKNWQCLQPPHVKAPLFLQGSHLPSPLNSLHTSWSRREPARLKVNAGVSGTNGPIRGSMVRMCQYFLTTRLMVC